MSGCGCSDSHHKHKHEGKKEDKEKSKPSGGKTKDGGEDLWIEEDSSRKKAGGKVKTKKKE